MTQGAIYVRELAYRVFLSAEKQESSPSTLQKAPQSYLAAINFLQVYRGVFLEDPSVLELGEEERSDELTQIDEKSKYAKWRIIEIKKQLMNTSASSSPANKYSNLPMSYKGLSFSPPVVSPQKPAPTQTSTQISTPPVNTNPQPYQQAVQVSSPPALLYDPKVLADCEKYARHAISALNFDDVETAADNLRTALKLLLPYLKDNQK